VTEPLRSQLIRYSGEVRILFRTAWEHRRSRYPLIDDVGGGVCPKAAGASRWWEFVGLRVGVATNVGGSVYILSNDMTSMTSAESSHFGPTMIT
jgi:hypothetical protein